jgi:hypothetical protein
MPVSKAASVFVEPSVDLFQWRVMCVLQDETFHFVGCNAATCRGRLSSAITRFNVETGAGRMRSGRVYRLIGGSGFAGVAEYVRAVWCQHNKVDAFIDMTELYEPGVRHDDARSFGTAAIEVRKALRTVAGGGQSVLSEAHNVDS